MTESPPERPTDDVIRASELLCGLGPPERSVLTAIAVRQRYESDCEVMRQDDPCPGFFLVDAGLTRLSAPVLE